MEYPSEDEIKRRLRPVKWGLWLAGASIVAAGVLLERFQGVDGAVEKSGGVLIAMAIVAYFLLERFDYRTGNSADLFDSSNHAVPRRYMQATEAILVVLGTVLATFGAPIYSRLSLLWP